MLKISDIVATALLLSACNHENNRPVTPTDSMASTDHGSAGTSSGGGTGSPSGTTDNASGTAGTSVSDSGSGLGTTVTTGNGGP